MATLDALLNRIACDGRDFPGRAGEILTELAARTRHNATLEALVDRGSRAQRDQAFTAVGPSQRHQLLVTLLHNPNLEADETELVTRELSDDTLVNFAGLVTNTRVARALLTKFEGTQHHAEVAANIATRARVDWATAVAATNSLHRCTEATGGQLDAATAEVITRAAGYAEHTLVTDALDTAVLARIANGGHDRWNTVTASGDDRRRTVLADAIDTRSAHINDAALVAAHIRGTCEHHGPDTLIGDDGWELIHAARTATTSADLDRCIATMTDGWVGEHVHDVLTAELRARRDLLTSEQLDVVITHTNAGDLDAFIRSSTHINEAAAVIAAVPVDTPSAGGNATALNLAANSPYELGELIAAVRDTYGHHAVTVSLGPAAATTDANIVAELPVEAVLAYGNRSTLEAIDELLGGRADLWELFDTLGDGDGVDLTVGELVDSVRTVEDTVAAR